MSSLDPISELLRRYGVGDGAENREQAREHYDQIAGAVPQDVLATVIGPAIGTLPPDQIETRVRNSATEMTPQQRGGFLETLLGGLGAQSGGLRSILDQIGVSPQVADDPQQATPEDVGRVAAYTKQQRPEIFDQAMGFYAKHPTLDGARAAERILFALTVKPGMTSPATLLHRYEEDLLTGEDAEAIYRRDVLPAKLRIELDYLNHRTVGEDLHVLAQTVAALFAKRDRLESNRGSQWRI